MSDIPALEAWSDDDLDALGQAIEHEKSRRYTIRSVEKQMDKLVWDYSAAVGRKSGDVWVPPTGAHDSYPQGSIVSHDGKQWISLIAANVWEPGDSGWREYAPPASGIIPDYVAPTGAHDAYMLGDRVTHQGKVYESLLDSNVYSPLEYSHGWVEVDPNEPEEGTEPETPAEPEPEVPVDPEPEPVEPEEPAVPEWSQPTGGHDTYSVGDRVLFQGQVYESVIDGNSWSPTGYPAGWKKV